MDLAIIRYCLLVFFTLSIEASSFDNETLPVESREPRVSGRIVKLYSGNRPEPVRCIKDGFQSDPQDCAVFYRCVRAGNGKYTVFRFQCGPGTVYDPDVEICNHPRSTKRSECGGLTASSINSINTNEIDEAQQELPSPIHTKIPVYTERTSTVKYFSAAKPAIVSSERPSVATLYPFATSTVSQHQKISTTIISTSTKYQSSKATSISTARPSTMSTVREITYFTPTTSYVTRQPSFPNGDICTFDGFMGDSENCRKFYRCVGNQRGGFVRYEFSCSESTIWDDDIQGCNHPWAVKRSKCGRSLSFDDKSGSYTTQPAPEISSNKYQETASQSIPTTRKQPLNFGAKLNTTVEKQQQISYDTKVTNKETQTSKGPVIQHQNQIDQTKESGQIYESSSKSTTLKHVQGPNNSSHINKLDNSECTESGFVGDSNDCKKFYRCVDNGRGGFTRYEYSCGEGTVWDASIEACNHAWAVKECGGKVSTEAPIATTTTKTSQFYPTDSSKPTQNYYPTSESSNAEDIDGVGYGHDSHQYSTSSEKSTTAEDSKGEITECTSSGFIGDANNCKIFYRCVASGKGSFTKYEFKCGEGTLWDQDIEACNHAWAVKKCGGNTSTTLHQVESTTSKETSASSTYVQTSISYKPSTTVSMQNDDYDVGYGSHNGELQSTIKTTKEPQGQENNNSNTCKSDGFIGDKNDCKKFYRCVDNGNGGFIQYEFNCGENTVWDSRIQACNHVWAVESCSGSGTALENQETTSKPKPTTIYEEITSTYITQSYGDTEKPIHATTGSTETSSITSNENNKCQSSGFMGDNKDCKKFYRCVDNGDGSYTRFEFSCGEGTVWDSKINSCNHAWAVAKCGGNYELTNEPQVTAEYVNDDEINNEYGIHSSISSDGTTHSSTSISGNEVSTASNEHTKCVKSGFIGDSGDCKKFYRCVDDGKGNFKRYEFYCGEGTAWDQSIEACNHASIVKECGKSNNTNGPAHIQSDNTSEMIITWSEGEDQGYNHYSTEKTSTAKNDIYPENQIGSDVCSKEGFFADKNDCIKFYRCVDNGKGGYSVYEFSCGEGTVWNQEIQVCDHTSSDKRCSNKETKPSNTTKEPQHDNDEMYTDTTTKIYSTSESLLISSSQKPQTIQNSCEFEGFYGDSFDCKKFYRCVDNGKGSYTKYDFTCGEGTIWDQEIEACNHESNNNKCPNTAGSNQTSESHSENDKYTSTSTSTLEENSTEKNETSSSKPSEHCSSEGFHADPNDCMKFIRCVSNGKGGYIKFEFSCGEGTVWVQESLACDHASSDKHCGKEDTKPISTTKEPHHDNDEMYTDTTTKTSFTSTSASISSSQTPQNSQDICVSEGFYGDSADCKKFYRCVDNGKGSYTKYDFTCGEETIWDQEIKACNHESNNNKCSYIASSSQTNEPDSENDKNTSTLSTSTQIEYSTEKTETSSSTPSEQCLSEGFHANPSDCTKFIRCVNNGKAEYTKYDFSCGEGTVWVQEIQACDHDNGIPSCDAHSQSSTKPEFIDENHHSSSQSSISSSSLPSTPSKEDDEYNENSSEAITSGTEGCSAEGFYANSNDCRQFYRCVENSNGKFTKYDFVCGEGTAWDANIQTCNHISEVKSCLKQEENQTKPVMQDEDAPQATDGTTLSTEANESKDACNKEGYYGNSRDCKMFYRCVDNGKGGFMKYDYSCGDGTIWDQDITACNHPQDVTNPSCSQNQDSNNLSSTSSSTTSSPQYTTTTTENSSQSPSNCSEESSKKPDSKNATCSKAGYYANPNDCKKFYRCVDWDGNGKRFSVYHFDCGEGTIWDPALDTCNHEDSVYPPRDCSGSQSQSENVGQATTTEGIVETTTQQSTTSEETTTQESTTSEQTTTQQSTTSEQTTTQQQITSEQTTTQQSTTSEQTTTQQSTTPEQTTTQQSTTSEQTTTQQSTTSEQTITQQSTTSEQTTTQQSTTSEQTTTQQSTTPEKPTTQQSSTSEQTTTQQSATSEQTTTQQSTTPEQTTTQQSTTNEQTTSAQTISEQTTTQQSTTSEETTTQQSTTSDQTTTGAEETTQVTTTEENTTTENSTTEQSTSTTENGQESTTEEPSPSEKQCLDLDEDQYALICPTSFKRHPKYCNLFYQCTEDDDSHEVKVAVFNCPNNTIYDESKTQCVEEDKADKKCSGEIAKRRRVKRLDTTYKEPIMVNTEKQKCLGVGNFPFEKDTECSPGFLKCEKSKSGKLRGYVYQCPEGYIYWSISKRCELINNVRDCKRSVNDWSGRWEIPTERKNIDLKKIK